LHPVRPVVAVPDHEEQRLAAGVLRLGVPFSLRPPRRLHPVRTGLRHLLQACRMILHDSFSSLNRHSNRAYESPAPPSCHTCGSKSISSYTSYGSRRRRSTFTPHARRFGPVTPQSIASAAEIFPTPSVRM